VRRLERA
jgi:DNA repair photolyase